MVINFKKIFNLNSYEWWRNHRRFITLGIFLALFATYIKTPSSKDFTIRDTCAKLNSSYQITGLEAIKKLKLNSIKDFDDRTIANFYCERYLGIR
tara:strand:+ start:15 stop:299 length:285 start_codon:yes stop_codon:yes gene_type:complete